MLARSAGILCWQTFWHFIWHIDMPEAYASWHSRRSGRIYARSIPVWHSMPEAYLLDILCQKHMLLALYEWHIWMAVDTRRLEVRQKNTGQMEWSVDLPGPNARRTLGGRYCAVRMSGREHWAVDMSDGMPEDPAVRTLGGDGRGWGSHAGKHWAYDGRGWAIPAVNKRAWNTCASRGHTPTQVDTVRRSQRRGSRFHSFEERRGVMLT